MGFHEMCWNAEERHRIQTPLKLANWKRWHTNSLLHWDRWGAHVPWLVEALLAARSPRHWCRHRRRHSQDRPYNARRQLWGPIRDMKVGCQQTRKPLKRWGKFNMETLEVGNSVLYWTCEQWLKITVFRVELRWRDLCLKVEPSLNHPLKKKK